MVTLECIVLETCLGVYCHDDFKNIQYVIDYIDAAQDVCDDIEKQLDFID